MKLFQHWYFFIKGMHFYNINTGCRYQDKSQMATTSVLKETSKLFLQDTISFAPFIVTVQLIQGICSSDHFWLTGVSIIKK
jgi:hypothetical protein